MTFATALLQHNMRIAYFLGGPTRTMVQKAMQWGHKTGNVRVNEIHGEEEVRMVLNETFVHRELHEEQTTREGNIEMEVRGTPCYPILG